MNRTKKQHFVPQFYLRYFTDTQGKIHAFDITNQSQFATTPGNVAHERSFYDDAALEEFVGKPQFTESVFANTEAEAADFFRKLIAMLDANNLSSLSRDDYRQLADHIITQERRTLEARRHIAEIAKMAGEKLENDIQFQQEYLLFHKDVLKEIEYMCDRHWIFWRNKTNDNFYTSDHPVVRYWYKEDKCQEFFFPITPMYGVSILVRDDLRQQPEDRIIKELNDPERVRQFNFLLVTQCNRQVFSAKDDFRLAEELIKMNPTLTEPNRPRFLNI
jgi:hypothetical protein